MKKSKWVSLCLGYGALAVLAAALIGCSSGDVAKLFGGGSGGGSKPDTIVVTDTNNERILLYSTPTSTNMNAVTVIGQPDMTSTGTGLGPANISTPQDAVVDPSGNLWVVDDGNTRVLEFKPPFTNGMSAVVAIGQPDLNTKGKGTSQNQLAFPSGAIFDSSGNLWIMDSQNRRVLEFKPPFTSGMSASLVIGQPDYTDFSCRTTAQGLCAPWQGLAFDSSGDLWVADSANNRILEFKPPFSTFMAASAVIGQPDFTSGLSGTSATQGSHFYGIAFDSSGDLWATDYYNNRVLEFKPPFSNGMAAALVLGQANFTSSASGTSATTMHGPYDLAIDSKGNLYVADTSNHRVLVFTPPFSNGMAATQVLGQPDLNSNAINQGATLKANTLNYPSGVATFH